MTGQIMVFITTFLAFKTTLAEAQNSAKLNCIEFAQEFLEPAAAATLCRGVTQRNLSAVLDCAEYNELAMPAIDLAQACQRAGYDTITAVRQCLKDSLDQKIASSIAANLCEGVSFATYTERFNCYKFASESVEASVAATLCGGI